MTSAVVAHLGNAPDLETTSRYAAIIGERPSQGARSPSLWNAIFTETDFPASFHPFDVAPEYLLPLMRTLREETRFIGGAVAVPYKSAMVSLLDDIDPVARNIGAVNALYRQGAALIGTNTDGQAAIEVLRQRLGAERMKSCRALVIGAGGTGVAVAFHLANEISPKGQLLICNREMRRATDLVSRLGGNSCAIEWPPRLEFLSEIDILINCTSAGFATGPDARAQLNCQITSLSSQAAPDANKYESIASLQSLSATCLVFDVIYQPRKTLLLSLAESRGLPTLSGLSMNLEQAVIAFSKAVPEIPTDTVRKIMATVP